MKPAVRVRRKHCRDSQDKKKTKRQEERDRGGEITLNKVGWTGKRWRYVEERNS
jgi:hypothetical protein